MADGFLGRWSRRKQEVREGRATQDVSAVSIAAAATPVYVPPALHATAPQENQPNSSDRAPETSVPSEAAPPHATPTLDDVQTLTPQSDFSPFMARDVTPDVKNAAMKKLFADPHFNVMDGMDVYIDDYSRPDPLPAAMLRKLAGAKFLRLFDDKPEDTAPPSPARQPATGHTTSPSTEPSSASATLATEPPHINHDHTDLRLQQDHATRPPGPGEGTG